MTPSPQQSSPEERRITLHVCECGTRWRGYNSYNTKYCPGCGAAYKFEDVEYVPASELQAERERADKANLLADTQYRAEQEWRKLYEAERQLRESAERERDEEKQRVKELEAELDRDE